jgi:hypothetical protein
METKRGRTNGKGKKVKDTLSSINNHRYKKLMPPPPLKKIRNMKGAMIRATYTQRTDHTFTIKWPSSKTLHTQVQAPAENIVKIPGGFKIKWKKTKIPDSQTSEEGAEEMTVGIKNWHLIIPHRYPDIIAINTHKKSIHIIDVTFCDDKHVLTLNENWSAIKGNWDLWDQKGIILPNKREEANLQDRNGPRRRASANVQYCPPARYHNRYNRLKIVLQKCHPEYTTRVHAVVIGVTGAVLPHPLRTLHKEVPINTQRAKYTQNRLALTAFRAIPKILTSRKLAMSP